VAIAQISKVPNLDGGVLRDIPTAVEMPQIFTVDGLNEGGVEGRGDRHKGAANKKHPAVIPAQAGIHGLALRLSRYFIAMQLPNLASPNL
jgi:hypothetical protein